MDFAKKEVLLVAVPSSASPYAASYMVPRRPAPRASISELIHHG